VTNARGAVDNKDLLTYRVDNCLLSRNIMKSLKNARKTILAF